MYRIECLASVFGVKADGIDDREGPLHSVDDRFIIVHVGTDEYDGSAFVFDGGAWGRMP